MQNPKFAAIVLLFHPTSEVIKNIGSYARYVDKLFIADNSPSANYFIAEQLNTQNIIFIHDGENKGIAARLNEGAELAIKDNFDFLITFDQDSRFDEDMLLNYFDCVKQYPHKDYIAMFGVEHDKRLLNKDKCNALKNQILITSGSIINLNIFRKLKGFATHYFIDYVDTEFCMQAIHSSFETIKFNSIFLEHTIGNKSIHFSFKKFKRTERSLHSPIRLYYIVRNYFYLKRKYESEFSQNFKTIHRSFKIHIKNNILYSKQKMRVLKFIIEGYVHFKKGITGKHPDY